MFPLHFAGNVTRQGDRGSAMTEKVEGGWLILPRRYSVPELQTNAHRADDWISSCRIFDKKHARYFAERKRCIDTDILQCRKNFTPSRRKSKWVGRWDDCTSLHVTNATYVTARECATLVNFFKSWLRSQLEYDLSNSYLNLSFFALFIACCIWGYVADV